MYVLYLGQLLQCFGRNIVLGYAMKQFSCQKAVIVNFLETMYSNCNPKPSYLSQSVNIAVKPEILAAVRMQGQVGLHADGEGYVCLLQQQFASTVRKLFYGWCLESFT